VSHNNNGCRLPKNDDQAQAQDIKKNPKDHTVSAGKVIKRPATPAKPAGNVLLPTIDQ